MPTGTEVLVTLGLAGGSAVVGWFAKQVIDLRESFGSMTSDIRSIKQSVFGNPDIRTADGMIATVEATVSAVESLASEMRRLHERMSAIEGTCVAMHGDVIVRRPE